MLPTPKTPFTRSAGYLWAAPCTALGLLLALLACLVGARARMVNGVIEVAFAPQTTSHRRRISRLPFCAITLGHVIVGINHAELHRLRAHERVHVRQYERWGALLLLAYPASSLLQWIHGRRPYWDNHFEVQARALAGF